MRPTLRFEKRFGGSGGNRGTAVAVDRAGNVYVAGTTDSLDFPATSKVFQPQIGGTFLRFSIDRGKTWTAPSVPGPVYAVAGSPKQPGILFAGTRSGVMKSVDGGKTWSTLPAGPDSLVNTLVVDDDAVYAGTGSGIYKSADGGKSWVELGRFYNVMTLLASPARPGTLLVIVNAGNDPNVYRTTDGGATWGHLSNSLPGTFALALDPTNGNIVYAAASREGFYEDGLGAIYKSTDAGETWSILADLGVIPSSSALALNASALYAGTEHGVVMSRDGGHTWIQTPVRDATTHITVDPTDPLLVYANANGIVRSIDGGATWTTSLPVRQSVNALTIVPGNPSVVLIGASPGQNVFVTKWSADGTQMLYSTYLGGSFKDYATGIAVDALGNAFVTGYTYSSDFPVTAGAAQKKNAGGTNAFLAKISPLGDRLLHSTYIGGTGADRATSVALDGAGDAYLTGYAGSSDFPVTPGAAQSHLRQNCSSIYAGGGDAFVTRFAGDTGQITYSTYLGGSCGELGYGIAVDPSGNAVVVGVTTSPDFPVTDLSLQRSYGSGGTGFLAKLTPQGLVAYATFLGGAGTASAEAVALDTKGNVYVTGSTFGFDKVQFGFDTFAAAPGSSYGQSGPPQRTGAAYVLKLNSALNPAAWTRTYLKYVGASYGEGKSIAVDATGRAWLAGNTNYLGAYLGDLPFPVVHPFQAEVGNGFIAQLSADGSTLQFSSKSDGADALALDGNGNAFVTGLLNATISINGIVSAVNPAQGVLLLRIDSDVPSVITVEDPQRLIPQRTRYSFDGIAAGEFLVLSGTGLGPDHEVLAALTPEGRFPATLGGTTVTFDGIPAPLLSVQAGRVVCIVPFSVSRFSSSVLLQVQNSGVVSNSIRVGVVGASYALAGVTNFDGRVNSAEHPAAPGSIVTIYATGFGSSLPPGVDGAISAVGLIPPPITLPAPVTVDDIPAQILYLGAAPGQVSAVTQLNVRIPAQLTQGSHTLMIGGYFDAGTIPLYVGQ